MLLWLFVIHLGADIRSLCAEAAMGPVRELAFAGLHDISADEFAPVEWKHIQQALDAVSATVSSADLKRYVDWNAQFGTYRKIELFGGI